MESQEKGHSTGASIALPVYVCIYCGADITNLANEPFWGSDFHGLWYDRKRTIVTCRSCRRPHARATLDEAKMRLRLASLVERAASLESAVNRAEAAYHERWQQLSAQTSRLRIRLFGFPDNDSSLRSLCVELNKARDLLEWNKQAIQWLQVHFKNKIRSAQRQARERFEEMQEAGRQQKIQDEKDRDIKSSHELAEQGYDRHSFLIISTDYRRGNAVDNYFRKEIAARVSEAFNHRCALCGGLSDITFDHCGIPKNEGGNFALLSKDGRSVRLNIVTLCRSCNSAKGQIPFEQFFSAEQKKSIIACHEKLLGYILEDSRVMKLLKLRLKSNS